MQIKLGLVALCLLGCSKGNEATSAEGSRLYAEMCVTCHGKHGEGISGPPLRDWSRGETVLVETIDARMPLGAPEKCDRRCSESIARYILEHFRGEIACDENTLASPRGLRLLTRREYRSTVADLFGQKQCGVTSFLYDPKGRVLKSVHVAGSFNEWKPTWALALDGGVWKLTRAVPPGQHTYKLVLDGTEWIADPGNPRRAPDGFGGENSVLDSSCADDPTLSFPPDTRPEGFAYDLHGPGRVVTAVHADEYQRTAEALTRSVSCGGDCDAWVASFGRKAFRRPLSGEEKARYATLAKSKGAPVAAKAMLISPNFLYRSELGDKDGKLTPHEIASALSYMFWGTMPDEELLAAADSGNVDIEKQARRLLADPRSRPMVATFAEQWLAAEGVSSITKQDPEFGVLRASMLEETRSFVTHVVFDGSHKLDELFTADYTFVDEPLARFYGLSGSGKVTYPDARRSGILGHASVLSTTSHSDQTSPIRRGLFVRRSLLCQEFPPPPPNAGGVPKVDPSATTRERFAQHTANASCKSCHQYIDDVGFGFERFDAVGRWRDSENGKAIDAKGDMNDVERFGTGTHAPFEDLRTLGKTIAASSAARQCFVRQYYRFARGYKEGSDELCTVRTLEKKFAAAGQDIRELMIAVATSRDFVVRR